MARALAAEVKEIISTTLSVEEVEPFLATAGVLVTEHLEGKGISEELLAEIERWLAAHFAEVRDPKVRQKDVGDTSLSFHGRLPGQGLDATIYGQQVRMLDPTGILSKLMDKQRRPWVFRAGSPSSSC